MGAKWQRAVFTIPKSIKKQDRIELAEEIITRIRRNAENGYGIPFGESGEASKKVKFKTGYSEGYAKSIDFKIAGKSKGQTPDLTLSGDMLAALDIISEAPGKIIVGYDNGSEENGKADGNCRGTYGTNTPSEKKARNFMGLSESEFNKLLRKYEDG